ncbi:hypothetical protein FVE85_6087 [Porphyridium purpureum]|uniref:Uncharacterized protein n=1 Tax=Porphyridium purpureum TaxID=35688 RepID=A0A5J4Z5Z1_PORPP|nr:hypothetical protein FVE85_6087 [Porphyridium purpureum]|eukprot:POR8563..scf295_1
MLAAIVAGIPDAVHQTGKTARAMLQMYVVSGVEFVRLGNDMRREAEGANFARTKSMAEAAQDVQRRTNIPPRVVVQDGQVKAAFAPDCSLQLSAAVPIATVSAESDDTDAVIREDSPQCFLVGEFADRLFVEFQFGAGGRRSYLFQEPTIKWSATNSDGHQGVNSMQVGVEDYAVCLECGLGKFSVGFRCPEVEDFVDSATYWTVDIEVRALKTGSIQLRVQKLCAKPGSINPFVQAGRVNVAKQLELILSSAQDAANRSEHKGVLEFPHWISPNAASVLVGLIHQQPLGVQTFRVPEITILNPESKMRVRVHPSNQNGGIVPDEYTSFAVNFECADSDSARILVTIPIPPFDPVFVRMAKNCGGLPPASLSVSTIDFGERNVYHEGILVSASSMDGTGSFDADALFMDESVNVMDFFLESTDREEELRFEPFMLTVNNESTAFARVVVPPFQSLFFMNPAGQAIAPLSSKRLRTHVICKRAGLVTIRLDLKVVAFAKITVVIEKRCKDPRIHTARDPKTHFIRLVLGLLVLGVGAYVAALRYVRARRRK